MSAVGASKSGGRRWHGAGVGDKRENLMLALSSGVLLGLPWVFPTLSFLIFIAWVPLLYLERKLRPRDDIYLVFNYALLSFLLWNILGTWWIVKVHFLGAVFIMLANALLQALCFWLASRVGRAMGLASALPFALVWMGYEYFHEWWDLAWPWLNLGNALASSPVLIQWYEYTGARGGTLWIILANLACLWLCRAAFRRNAGGLVPPGAAFLLVLALPTLFSWHAYRNFEEGKNTLSFALVQQNLDPYTEKFVPARHAEHLESFFKSADRLCDEKTHLLLGPETLFLHQIDEKDPGASPHVRRLQNFQKKYPQLNLLVGVHSFERNPPGVMVPGSRYDAQGDFYFEAFNSALFLAPGADPQFYHKTKLVPMFERMPFVQHLGFLGKISLELGGYNGTYSNRQARSHFEIPDGSLGILPIACFESIFSPYCAERLPEQKGFIIMITNDGWWKNTPGYRHHFNFSRMRAIECRRNLIRAANNGISALIDARGVVVTRTSWWQAATLKGRVQLMSGRTLFSRYGDYLGRTALLGAFILCLYAGMRHRLRRNQ